MVRPVQYLREVQVELSKVSWPTREQTLNKTLLVIAVSVIVATYLGLVDYMMQQAITRLL